MEIMMDVEAMPPVVAVPPPVVFNIGDVVKVVKKGRSSAGYDYVPDLMDIFVNDGRTYTVVQTVGYSNNCVKLCNGWWFKENCLELVKNAPKPKPSKLNRGDGVYINVKPKNAQDLMCGWLEEMDDYVRNGVAYKVKAIYKPGTKDEYYLLSNGHHFPVRSLAIMPPKRIRKGPFHTKDLRTALNKAMAKRHGGCCSYALEFKGGKKRLQPRDACHARITWGGREGENQLTKFVNSLGHAEHYLKNNKANIELYRTHVDYVLNHSPWKKIVKTHSLDIAFKKGILFNVTKYSIKQIMGCCLILRDLTESRDKLKVYGKILKNGFSPATAYIMCNGFTHDGHWRIRNFGGQHGCPLNSDMSANALFKFFRSGYEGKDGAPYSEYGGNYYGTNALIARRGADGSSIQNWITKQTKTKTIGEGWSAVTVITEESVMEVAATIEKLLKQEDKPEEVKA